MKPYPITTPGGSDTQVQYKKGSIFGGDSALTFNDTTKTLATTGTIDGSAGEILVEDNDTNPPTGKSDGYIGAAIIGGTARVYFAVNGTMYYLDGTAADVPENGGSIGLLLTLTYAGL